MEDKLNAKLAGILREIRRFEKFGPLRDKATEEIVGRLTSAQIFEILLIEGEKLPEVLFDELMSILNLKASIRLKRKLMVRAYEHCSDNRISREVLSWVLEYYKGKKRAEWIWKFIKKVPAFFDDNKIKIALIDHEFNSKTISELIEQLNNTLNDMVEQITFIALGRHKKSQRATKLLFEKYKYYIGEKHKKIQRVAKTEPGRFVLEYNKPIDSIGQGIVGRSGRLTRKLLIDLTKSYNKDGYYLAACLLTSHHPHPLVYPPLPYSGSDKDLPRFKNIKRVLIAMFDIVNDRKHDSFDLSEKKEKSCKIIFKLAKNTDPMLAIEMQSHYTLNGNKVDLFGIPWCKVPLRILKKLIIRGYADNSCQDALEALVALKRQNQSAFLEKWYFSCGNSHIKGFLLPYLNDKQIKKVDTEKLKHTLTWIYEGKENDNKKIFLAQKIYERGELEWLFGYEFFKEIKALVDRGVISQPEVYNLINRAKEYPEMIFKNISPV